MTKHCYLYRLFGSDDALLYVGISLSALGRLGEHLAEKSWASEVVRTTIEAHPSREAALAAERSAIQSEGPRYNVVHNGKRRTPNTGAVTHGLRRIPGDPEFWSPDGLAGQCVAFGLRSGDCPVGLVRSVDEGGLWLALFSFWDGTFGHQTDRVLWSEVKTFRIAERYSLAEVKRDPDRFDVILFGDESPSTFCFFETKPLGAWQTKWRYESLPPSALLCRRPPRFAVDGPCPGVVKLARDRDGVLPRCDECSTAYSLTDLAKRA